MKSRKTALFAAILIIISVLVFAAHAVEDENLTSESEENKNLILDSFEMIHGGAFEYTPYARVAFLLKEYDDLKVGDELTSGKGLSLSLKADENTGDTVTVGTFGAAYEPLDLKYYTNISFFFASGYADAGKNCIISIELFSGEESVKYSRSCVSGQWTKVIFDISDFVLRDRIDAIKIEATFPSQPEAEENYVRLENIEAGGYIEENIYDRFMAGSYLNSTGNAVAFVDEKLNFDAKTDAFLDADLPAFSLPDTNGIYFEIENAGADTLVFEYMTMGDNSYSVEKKVEIKLLASSEMRVYYAKLPDISKAIRWKISSKNDIGGFTLCAVKPIELGLDAFSSVSGTTSAVNLSDGGKYLRVSGKIPSSVVSNYSGSKLGLYVLSPGADISDIANGSVEPMASTPISMDYNFKIPISESFEIELSKKFVVVITDRYEENGDVLVVGTPSFIANPGAFSGEVKTAAKDLPHGIISEDLSDITSSAAGFTIINVPLDLLLSDTNSGELHVSNGEHRYYNSEYVALLDHKIRALYGTEVYIRIIQLDHSIGEESTSPFSIPDVSAEELAYDMYILGEFLADRYSGGEYGSINGIILGYSVDDTALHGAEDVPLSEYVEKYADALCVLRAGAVRANPGVSIYAAVSDSLAVSDNSHSALTFIDALTYEMKERGVGDWYVAVDSTRVQTDVDLRYFTAASVKALSEYLMSISAHYSSGCDGVMYIWQPDAEINNLTDNYIYSMLTFMKNSNVIRFATVISEVENKNDVTEVLKFGYLENMELNEVLKSAFERDLADFDALVAEFGGIRIKKQQFAADDSVGDSVIGEHAYFDFTQLYSNGGWYPAENCKTLTSIFSGVRRLSASFVANGSGGHMAMAYKFEYPENMSIAPYVAFDVEFAEEYGEVDVMVIFGAAGVRAEYTAVVSGRGNIVCDLTEFDGRERVEYIKILVFNRDEDINMSLYSVKGHSAYYTDQSLESAILAEREKVRNEAEAEFTVNRTFVGVAVAAVAVFSVLVFLALSRKKTE